MSQQSDKTRNKRAMITASLFGITALLGCGPDAEPATAGETTLAAREGEIIQNSGPATFKNECWVEIADANGIQLPRISATSPVFTLESSATSGHGSIDFPLGEHRLWFGVSWS